MRKLKFLFLAIFIAAASLSICAQSVVITKRKVTYQRPKPQMKFKRTFAINYPTVRASTPAISAKIERELSYFKLFGFTLREEMNGLQWLEEADFEVEHNKNGILSVALFIDGSGAYPDRSVKHVVVNSRIGARAAASTLFSDLPSLARLADQRLQEEIAKAKKEIKADKDIGDLDREDLFDGTIFDVYSRYEFSVKASGVTFYYDYGFPHVIQAIQPAGEFHFSWAELRPFVTPASLLAAFVR
jgi:hypothetical protein